jgi:hypothetical protein
MGTLLLVGFIFRFEWKLIEKIYLMCLFYQALSEGKPMLELSTISILIGLAALAGGIYAVVFPDQTGQWIMGFPRSIWPGRILVVVDLVFAAYEGYPILMHFIAWDGWKTFLICLTPVSIYLCINYLDELLSPRALGGFLLLLAGPVLDIARWHPSDWRLVMVVLAYIWIGLGLLFLLSPWWFRRITQPLVRNLRLMRFVGMLRTIMGAGLIILGWLVY